METIQRILTALYVTMSELVSLTVLAFMVAIGVSAILTTPLGLLLLAMMVGYSFVEHGKFKLSCLLSELFRFGSMVFSVSVWMLISMGTVASISIQDYTSPEVKLVAVFGVGVFIWLFGKNIKNGSSDKMSVLSVNFTTSSGIRDE